MRGGLSAIQQTLTPEAASVLTHSIAEAGRRNHGQTTPLHVAATLLASPTGFLRQACIRSHPNSSHPLQCRALELCFSVALERLPTAQNGGGGGGAGGPGPDPPISNALMAALKRAQAHQRRGCPEQQQQPLLAVKVELEQLIISILDDPSVSRVMREASFSSPAVKAAIEQLVTSTQPNSVPGSTGPRLGLGFRPAPTPAPPLGAGGHRNLYLNPRLQQQQQQQQQFQQQQQQQQQHGNVMQGRGDDVKKVMDILSRSKKRNPILVGESGPEEVIKEAMRRIGSNEIRDEGLKGVEVVSSEKELGSDRGELGTRVKEMVGIIERKLAGNSKGVIVDLGDLKWLVDQPANPGVSEAARGAVAEVGKILRKYGESSKIWLIGIATCETYLRCQVYHPEMENEWDLQVVSIVARPPLSGMLPRFGSNGGILSSSVECLSPMKGFPMPAPSLTRRVSENLDPCRRFSCCPQCAEKYDQELAKLEAGHTEKASSESKSLPPWLQNAKTNDVVQNKEQDVILRQKTQELQKKWKETCLQLHPSFHNSMSSERIVPTPLSMMGLCNPNVLGRQPFQPKLQQQRRALGDGLQLNISSLATPQPTCENPKSTPGSPVRTELVLGPTKTMDTVQDKGEKDGLKDFLGCISSEPTEKPVTAIPADADSYKRLLKGLIAKVWWQTDAACAVAAAVTQCRSGNGKRRAGGTKGDIWMLFSGPDRIGKRKLAAALSELICDASPILISLGSRHDVDESEFHFRGKTVIDRIVEAVRRNPFSVIMLQDIDEADTLVRASIKRAMERGRFSDSHGREISLGNVIFVVASNRMPDQHQLKNLSDGVVTLSEEKMASLASGGWQLRISIGEKAATTTGKRSPSWMDDDDQDERATKQRKEEAGSGLSFDLNQMADIDDERLDGSNNSSDLTVDHEEEHGHENRGSPTTTSAAPNELLGFVDEAIPFKAVDFKPIRQNIERSIITKFSSVIGERLSVKIESDALEKILSGMWLGQTSVESWIEKVLLPSINQLKTQLPSLLARNSEGKLVARLELDQESESRNRGDWLPGNVLLVTDAQ